MSFSFRTSRISASRNRPGGNDFVSADAKESIVEVHVWITVGNDKLQTVAKTDLPARIVEEQSAMLVAVELILDSGDAFDFRAKLAIGCESLIACVDGRAMGVVLADDCRQNAERGGEVFIHGPTLSPHSTIVHVHEDIGSCLKLGHAF